jgi:hypothetical protein
MVHNVLSRDNACLALESYVWPPTVKYQYQDCLTNTRLEVGDQTGGVGAGGERYGWVDAFSIRSQYGERNPDSTKLFAMGLSMEEYLWHSGTAVEFKSEYDRLSGKQGDPTIQNWNLPSPAAGPWIP